MSMSRYERKPILRLLDCYVFRAIGKLSVEQNSTLVAMTSKLREIYYRSGEWYEIVESTMRFSEDMETEIIKLWEKNQLIAQDIGEELSSEKFAHIFVDRNFGNEVWQGYS